MIVKFSKFEKVIFCTVIIAVSFIFAIRSEERIVPSSSKGETVVLPIVMYHHITQNKDKSGKYTVLDSEFVNDLKWIEKNGYTTVTVADVVDFVNGKNKLPENPIMITFDDGFESFYKIAYPILKEKNMKAVVSVIGHTTEKYSEINDHNINYSNLTWTQIAEMNESGLIEFQNHSYDMHKSEPKSRKGISKLKNESAESYKEFLSADLTRLQSLFKEKCGITPLAVAYPYGAYSKGTKEIVEACGFVCTLGCEEKTNLLKTFDKDCLFNLGRFNRESGISTEEFFKRIA